MKKKIVSILLATMMIASMVPMAGFHVSAEVLVSGTIPLSNLTWNIQNWDSKTGNVLFVEGNDYMPDFSTHGAPWYRYGEDSSYHIDKIIVAKGVHNIGENAFRDLDFVSTVEIFCDGTIRNYAFYDCDILETLIINEGIATIGYCAFDDCERIKTIIFPSTLHSIYEDAFLDLNEDADDGYRLENVYYAGTNWDNVAVTSDGNEELIKFYNNYGVKCADQIYDYSKIHWDGDCHWYELKKDFSYPLECPRIPHFDGNGNGICDGTNCWAGMLDTSRTLSYIDENGRSTTVPFEVRYLGGRETELTSGWYAVGANLNFGDTCIKIKGDVKLILKDYCGITTNRGIDIPSGNKLTVYSQSINLNDDGNNHMGYIKVTGAAEEHSGIGSLSGYIGSTAELVINGGKIESQGGNYGAGIGGYFWPGGSARYDLSDCFKLTIHNGLIKAYGGNHGAGIGSGEAASVVVTIDGGKIEARGGNQSAGIGSGYNGGSKVYISGGDIAAWGGSGAPGIGSGCGSSSTSYVCMSGSPTIEPRGSDAPNVGAGQNGGYCEIHDDRTGVSSECTVTYNVNYDGGENLTRKVRNMERADNITPERDGYTFRGWFADAACKNPFNFEMLIREDVTMYAKWEIQNRTVTFNENYSGGKTNTKTLKYGDTVESFAATRNGYHLEGWYTEPECENKFDFSSKILKNITLYAKWIGNTTVTFDVQYDESKNTVKVIGTGETVASVTPDKRPDYTFDGWYTEPECENKFDFKTKINADLHLYAKWQPDRIITFDPNGGEGETFEETIPYKTRSAKYTAIPVREGYGFTGWFDGADYRTSNRIDFANVDITESMTVYAGWEADREFSYTKDGTENKVTVTGDKQLNAKNTPLILGEKDAETWYAVAESCEALGRMEIIGNVHLILCDGCTLEVPQGITLTGGNTLTVYGQSQDLAKAGKLLAHCNTGHAGIGSPATADRGSGKNVDNAVACGTLTLYGGTVDIENANANGVGFGGGKGGNAKGYGESLYSILLIYGRSGNGGNGGNLNIFGGSFTAKGGYKSVGGGLAGVPNQKYDPKYQGSNGADTKISIAEGCSIMVGTSAEDAAAITTIEEFKGEKYVSFVVKEATEPENEPGNEPAQEPGGASGFTLSGGNWWIILVGAVVIIAALVAVVIAGKKKKNKNSF